MTIHTTKTGYVELADQWGHGKAASGDWTSAPATITADDGDGHYDAWRYKGTCADAMQTLAPLYCRDNCIVTRDGNRLTVETAPADFWIDAKTGGPFTDETEEGAPNLAKYPNAIAF